MNTFTIAMILDIPALQRDLAAGKKITINLKYVDEPVIREFYGFAMEFLSFMDQLFLVEVVSTVFKEILNNACKANAKRLFFERANLDIHKESDYTKGMNLFQEQVTAKWNEQEPFLRESPYFIKFEAIHKNGSLLITIENNAFVLPQEQTRIVKRMEAARKYNDLSDAFMDMLDSTESAGLGLVLTQILLKNSGIGQTNFRLEFLKDRTIAHFTIPGEVVPIINPSKFNEQILAQIETLPTLPTSHTRIIALCNNADTDINVLTSEIEKDPALAADLLKISNSPAYRTRAKANNILSAVKVVGMKNIKNMIYVSGVTKIMNQHFPKVQAIWDHSAKCSFYARQIAIDHGKSKLADLVATAGLLHDIGKLILLSLDKKLVKQIQDYNYKEHTNSVIVEEMSIGISHPEIAAKLLSKWAFPEELVYTVQYHHRPFLAPPQHKELIEIIYLANMITDCSEHKSTFFTIDERILKTYKLDNEAAFQKYLTKLDDNLKLSLKND